MAFLLVRICAETRTSVVPKVRTGWRNGKPLTSGKLINFPAQARRASVSRFTLSTPCGPQISPSRTAWIAAAVRDSQPSLFKICCTWFSTVR